MFAGAVTSDEWLKFFLENGHDQQVNFWTPTGWTVSVSPGCYFAFMTKGVRKVGGYGRLSFVEKCTVKQAWNSWGRRNGVQSLAEFSARLNSIRGQATFDETTEIGCNILTDCVFIRPEDQLTPEKLGFEFAPEIVKWKCVQSDFPIETEPDISIDFALVDPALGTTTNTKSKLRLGQNKFRHEVLTAYDRKCAISGEGCERVLDAAHIQPYVNQSSNHIQNGICLRRDIHSLFDDGLITLRTNGKIKIASSLKGTGYEKFDGTAWISPVNSSASPSIDALEHHRVNVFRQDK